jgi:hypothetical protein
MRFHTKPFTVQQGAQRGFPHAFVRWNLPHEYRVPLKALWLRIKALPKVRGARVSFRLFSRGAVDRISLRMPLRDSVPDTFTLVGDYEGRVTQLLELARQQVRAAENLAAPRTHDVPTELDYIP